MGIIECRAARVAAWQYLPAQRYILSLIDTCVDGAYILVAAHRFAAKEAILCRARGREPVILAAAGPGVPLVSITPIHGRITL